jgi:hypothetical protein
LVEHPAVNRAVKGSSPFSPAIIIMKATLEFNLPEESEEFELARNGAKLSCAVSDFQNYLRSKIKYDELSDEQLAVYEEVREKLFEMLVDQ